MKPLLQFLWEHRPWLVSLWVAFWVLASLVSRLLKRKNYSVKPHSQILFQERFGSGQSDRNWLTKIAGANKCLLITIAGGELLIRPWFPFNLFFLPEIYDLEHRIPIAAILKVTERVGYFGGRFVDIEFPLGNGGTRRMSLLLQRKQDFMEALKKSGVGSPPS